MELLHSVIQFFSKSTLFLFPQGYEIIHHTCCFRVNESQHACSLRNVFHIFFVYGHFKVIDLLDVAEYQMSIMIQTDVFFSLALSPRLQLVSFAAPRGSLGWSHLGPCTSRVCLESGFPLFSQCTYLLLVHYLPVCKDQFEPSLIASHCSHPKEIATCNPTLICSCRKKICFHLPETHLTSLLPLLSGKTPACYCP